MKRYPILFAKYGIQQDQRMTDVINRELLPWLEAHNIPIHATFASLPKDIPYPVEKFQSADLNYTGYTESWRVTWEYIQVRTPQLDNKATFAIFQRENFPISPQVLSHCNYNGLLEIFYNNGNFEDVLFNRILIFLHELAHLLYFQTGTPDILHNNPNDPAWLEQIYASFPKDRIPMIEVPDVPAPPPPPVRLYDWPVSPVFITQGFGEHPEIYGAGGHNGEDYRTKYPDTPDGVRPVKCSRFGTVVLAGLNGKYGNCVVIDHGDSYQTLYAHLSKILVGIGNKPAQGSIIGMSGATGWVTAPHLHFTLRKRLPFWRWAYINPADVLR